MVINFYSTLRNITGHSSIIYPINGNTSLLDILNFIAQEFPKLQIMLFEDGTLSSHMPVFLNGRNPRLLPDGWHTNISPYDTLSLFAPLASGKMNVEALQNIQLPKIISEGDDEN